MNKIILWVLSLSFFVVANAQTAKKMASLAKLDLCARLSQFDPYHPITTTILTNIHWAFKEQLEVTGYSTPWLEPVMQ